MTFPRRNRFHSLCPYFAMFPETFVETWLNKLTKPRDLVADLFSGRGTTAFQSLMMGRRAIACDVNDVAFCVSQAKTNPPAVSALRSRITVLEDRFLEDPDQWEGKRRSLPNFFRVAFAPMTLRQLLFLREQLNWKLNKTDTMLAAIILGQLHGESERSPSYLSNQMPRTISTKPAYSLRYWRNKGFKAPKRDVFDLVRTKATFRYASQTPTGTAEIFHLDMRELPTRIGNHRKKVRCIITSPPYFDVTNFEEDQWLRLWFLGGPPRPTRGRVSTDDRHSDANRYWSFIADMWRVVGQIADESADVVVRLGATRIAPSRIPDMLLASAEFAGRPVNLKSHETSPISRRQTDAFRPGSRGCRFEVDCHFQIE